MEHRLESRAPFLLGGIRRVHRYSDCAAGIPAQWSEFVAQLPLRGQISPITYGVLCWSNEVRQEMEYMCAVEVSDLRALPDGSGRMRVPEQQYAVFTYEGPSTGIREAWMTIWRDWLPTSGYVSAETPDFEKYDERFDTARDYGVVEIWFAVKLAA